MSQLLSPDLQFVYRLTAIAVGCGQVLAGMEMLFLHGTGRIETFLPWRIVRLRNRRTSGPRFLGLPLDGLYSRRGAIGLAVARCVAGIGAIMSSPFSVAFAMSLVVLLVILCIDSYRNIMGGEGSDQMFLVLTASLMVGGLPFAGTAAREIAIVFIAAQSVLSYSASGIAKVVSSCWRSGKAVSGVMSTVDYGIPGLGRFLTRHGTVATLAAWFVITFESTFVLSVADPRIALAYMAVGIAFHVGVASMLGLNFFMIAFPATYPAVLWVSQWVSQ